MKDYHTGRQLVLMLVDIVSRGGNLLLDIGPRADGRIPVIMEPLLGVSRRLQWKAKGDSVTIDLPDLPDGLRAEPAWALKLEQ